MYNFVNHIIDWSIKVISCEATPLYIYTIRETHIKNKNTNNAIKHILKPFQFHNAMKISASFTSSQLLHGLP